MKYLTKIMVLIGLLSMSGYVQSNSTTADSSGTSKKDFQNNQRMEMFYKVVRKAVGNEDVDTLAFLMKYPMKVSIYGQTLVLKNELEFKQHYHKINTPIFRQAFACVPYDKVSRSWRGYMIARGTVWLNLKYAASNDQSGGRDVRSLKQAKSENTQRKSTVPSAYYDASLWVPKVTKLTLGKHTEAFVQKCK